MNEDEFLREHLLLNDTIEDMLECRPKLTNVIKEYIESEGYLLSDASRFSHSLDAFHYNYQNAGENRDMIKIEINYSLRAHIFEPVYNKLYTFGLMLSIIDIK